MNLLRRVATLPVLRAVLLHPSVRRRVAAVLALRFLTCALATTTPARFLVHDLLLSRGQVRRYTIAETGVPVWVMHRRDTEALHELFRGGEYEPPAELRERLNTDRVRRIADVGANIGMFSAWAHGRWPQASIVQFEPDPDNLEVLRRWDTDSDAEATLVPACALPRDGEVHFTTGLGAGSAQAREAGNGTITLPAVDVFPHLAGADFVKLDIEGGEWAILSDPRMRDLHDVTIAMEYHRHLAPSLPALDAATRLLQNAGFEVGHATPNYWGHGTLWAWKD